MPQAAPIRGPLVWRDLDQKALDDAYDQAVYAPNRDVVLARIAAASEAARKKLAAPRRVVYGPSEHERLDIYCAAASKPVPVNLFVHGGAWLHSSAAAVAFLAAPLVDAGAHVVLIDFVNVAQTGGDLMPMAEQVSRAIAWTWRNAESFGGDREAFYVSAHSSGAHLAACALTRGWRGENLPADFCKGALLLGGMYDLAPVRLSARSRYVSFTDATEYALSPLRHIDGINTPLIIAHGSNESPEFERQSRDFFAALRAAGKAAELVVADGCNHFELLETMADSDGVTGRVRLRQMGLA